MQNPSPAPSAGPKHGAAPAATGSSPAAGSLSGDALRRRRLLLKGLGKGSAVVAAAVPIHTLAAPVLTPTTVRLCTVSGVQSNVGSGRTGVTTATCMGYSPAYYSTLSHWPGYNGSTTSNTVGGTTFTELSSFAAVFGSGPATGLLAILQGSAGSDTAVWITALLNGIKQQPGHSFPYTGPEVVAFYNDTPANASKALAFFRGYVQGVGV